MRPLPESGAGGWRDSVHPGETRPLAVRYLTQDLVLSALGAGSVHRTPGVLFIGSPTRPANTVSQQCGTSGCGKPRTRSLWC